MGGGASSLARLRKVLLIRAYNSRPKDQTVSEQFAQFRRINAHGDAVLTREDIKQAVGLTAPWFDDLLQRYTVGSMDEVHFESFVEFLESGRMPPAKSPPKMASPPKTQTVDTQQKENAVPESSQLPPSVIPVSSKSSGEPSKAAAASSATPTGIVAASTDSLYPDVLQCMGFKQSDGRAVVLHKGTGVALKGSFKRPGPQRPLWRKRETLLQERIVQYTTVDADGGVQELVETERSSTEILHMECKETGEFAHRESTQYEQTEVFNKETVSAEHGTEEYVHLKSKDDEYEHLESNMPNKQRAQEEAEAQAEAEAAAAAAAGGMNEDGEPLQDGQMPGSEQGSPPMWHGQHPGEEGSPGGSWANYGGGDPQNMWQAPDSAGIGGGMHSPMPCDGYPHPGEGYAHPGAGYPHPHFGEEHAHSPGFAAAAEDEDDEAEPQWWGAGHGDETATAPSAGAAANGAGGISAGAEGGGADGAAPVEASSEHEHSQGLTEPVADEAREDDGETASGGGGGGEMRSGTPPGKAPLVDHAPESGELGPEATAIDMSDID